ncbi:DUF2231 domain-containing protein [Aeromicrobium ginsengisoli]|uniref:DUF2231 domain-containing protein n=1 Tax=Aeromicrobium ginsengisoli TaxID=363867 RepID=A0A5M4FIE8_9ACTN|nr:DUF2231 domain-containing protein [Aeromicrobium ginsengisoli]KAA1399907.1 hypothetical protein ESP70_003895 [Aeromicrobium ginsengisoli]
MPNDFHGLPLHPLIVHATVVIVPLAALTVLLAALWPRFRAWAGPLPTGLSLVGLALVPLSTSTGETLERHVAHSALLERHTHLADGLLPWMIGLAVVASISFAVQRLGRAKSVHRSIPIVLAVLTLIVVVGATVQVVRIGESGAKAAWADTNMSS